VAGIALQSSDYQAIETAFKGMAVNSAFTRQILRLIKMLLRKRGALTAMLNYYRNVWQQRLLSWSVLEFQR